MWWWSACAGTRTCSRFPHLALKTYIRRNGFKFFTVFVFAVIDCVNQLVRQRIQYFNRICEFGRDKDLVNPCV
jgi:chloramphenicol O-acetyltransferase